MMVSVGSLPSAKAGSMTLPRVVLEWRGGSMMASFLIVPARSCSRFSIMSLWKGATSKLGIIARANRLRDRRVKDNRRILGETFNQGIILTALNKTLN